MARLYEADDVLYDEKFMVNEREDEIAPAEDIPWEDDYIVYSDEEDLNSVFDGIDPEMFEYKEDDIELEDPGPERDPNPDKDKGTSFEIDGKTDDFINAAYDEIGDFFMGQEESDGFYVDIEDVKTYIENLFTEHRNLIGKETENQLEQPVTDLYGLDEDIINETIGSVNEHLEKGDWDIEKFQKCVGIGLAEQVKMYDRVLKEMYFPGARTDKEEEKEETDQDTLQSFMGEDDSAHEENTYEFHGEAKEDIPGIEGLLMNRNFSDAEALLYIRMHESIYKTLSTAELKSAQEEIGEELSTEKVLSYFSMEVKNDKNLRAAFFAYAKEKGMLPEDKTITRIEFFHKEKREDQGVTGISFRITIDERDRSLRQRRTDTFDGTARNEYINLFTKAEKKEWISCLKTAAEAIMDGKRPDDVLRPETESGVENIYARMRYSDLHSPHMSDREPEKDNINQDSFSYDDDASEFTKDAAFESGTKGRTEYVSFTIIDHNGNRQAVRAAVDAEQRSIGLFVNEINARDALKSYELRFRGSSQPVFTVEKLFTPLEAALLKGSVKEAVAKNVALDTAECINHYYSTGTENRYSLISAAATANDYKGKALSDILPYGSTERESFERLAEDNRNRAGAVMKVLGFRYNQASWKTSLVMTATSVRNPEKAKHIPVIKIENVGQQGAKSLATRAFAYGLQCSYDKTNGVFSLWKQENMLERPMIDDWRAAFNPSDRDYNRFVLEVAAIRTEADRNGLSIDAKKGTRADEQSVWSYAKSVCVKEESPKEVEPVVFNAKQNDRVAHEYIKSMGLNLGVSSSLDHGGYALKSLSGHGMQVFEAPVIGNEEETVPFVIIGDISEREYEKAAAVLDITGADYFHDRKSESLYVSMSEEGRPSYELTDSYKLPDYEKLKDSYVDNAEKTIGALEARNIYRRGDYNSDHMRGSMLKGYGSMSESVMRVLGASEKDIRAAHSDIKIDADVRFFTSAFEHEVTMARDEVLGRASELAQEAADLMGRDK